MAEKENAAQKNAVKSQTDRITAQYEAKEAELRQASSREQERLEGRRDQVRGQIAKIDGLLATWRVRSTIGFAPMPKVGSTP